MFTRAIIPDQVTGHALNPRVSPWSVVVPEATTNIIQNPSFELGTTGWLFTQDGAGGFGQTSTRSFTGGFSCMVTRSGGTFCYLYTASTTFTPGSTYTWSLRIYREASVPIALSFQEYNSVPALIGETTKTVRSPTDKWAHEFITVRVQPATALTQVVVRLDGNGTCYLDCMQIEQKPYATTYCDGDQEGCYWTGTPHASQSKRLATERTGGRVWNFRDFNFDVIDTIGGGAPGVNVIDTPFALIGGGYYQRTTYPIRQFSIVGAFQASGLIEMGRRRAEMWNALRPDLVAPQQPVRLIYDPTACNDFARYGDNPDAIAIDAVYAGGLEGVLANSEIDRVALAFRVHEPGLIGSAIRDTSANLAYELVLSTADYFFVRNRLTGAFLDVGVNDDVLAIVSAPQGGVYVGGSFTSPATRIAHYNHATGTWTTLGSGGANGTVRALLLDQGGTLLAGGDFTSIGGVSVTGLARWNGTAWSAVGGSVAGGSARVQTIARDAFNYIYIGGSFTSVNGVAASNVARYLTFWEDLGVGTNAEVLALAVDGASNVYVGGAFTSAGGLTAYGIARWNGATWFQVGGTGLLTATERINDMLIGPDGRLFITGEFGDGMAQATDATNFAVWNGAWSSIGGSFSDPGLSINLLPDGNLFATGEFFEDGNPVRVVEYSAVLNGNRWLNADFMPEVPQIRAVGWDNEYEYYGGDNFSIIRGGETTTVTNANTAAVYPIITLYDATSVVCIKNYTTGDRLYFNLRMFSGETAVLKTGLNPSFVSNLRGDILPTIIAPSNPATFKLAPGVNHIYVFVWPATGNTAITMRYRRTYASLDQIM